MYPQRKLGRLNDEGQALFVGRSAELETLCALGREVAAGRPAAAMVVAEPGLVKTRLLAEIAPRLELPCVQLHGYEPAREIPLGTAGGLLRELWGVPEAGGRLEALLLGGIEAGAGLEAVRVFEAAFRCLVELGALAVVVDDVQWVDPETLTLFHYLLSAAEPAGVPLLVLCASRPAAEADAFAASLGGLLPRECFAELRLGPLEREEGIDLAVRLAPRLEREQAEALWEKAQGSPFWIAALAAEDRADASPARLIRSRYASLEVDAAQLFALLVVAAQPLGVADATELLDWEEQRTRRAVLVLASRALALPEGGRIRIAHDLIREAAARELPDAERRRLHRRLAPGSRPGPARTCKPCAGRSSTGKHLGSRPWSSPCGSHVLRSVACSAARDWRRSAASPSRHPTATASPSSPLRTSRGWKPGRGPHSQRAQLALVRRRFDAGQGESRDDERRGER